MKRIVFVINSSNNNNNNNKMMVGENAGTAEDYFAGIAFSEMVRSSKLRTHARANALTYTHTHT